MTDDLIPVMLKIMDATEAVLTANGKPERPARSSAASPSTW
jgi:hypothetical protein